MWKYLNSKIILARITYFLFPAIGRGDNPTIIAIKGESIKNKVLYNKYKPLLKGIKIWKSQ